MRKKVINSNDERQILIGMIVDSGVLGKIAFRWQRKMFRSDWANHVGQMCVDYYNKYGKAPQKSIEGLFRRFASKRDEDDKTVEVVDKFLLSLNGEYEQLKEINPDFVIDMAKTYLNRVRLERLAEEVQDLIDGNDIDKADALISNHHRLELGMGSFVDVLTDKSAIQTSLEAIEEPLFKYPGALGDFFGYAMARDSFIAFTGPEKRGKTFWLLDVAWRAMTERRKVVFFAVGDMSQDQMMHRFVQRGARMPLRPWEYDYPIEITHDYDAPYAEVVTKVKKQEHDLTSSKAAARLQRVHTSLRSNTSLLKLSCWPNDTINVAGIRDELAMLERDGWVADVIVIDYADILAPPAGVTEFRHQQNKTWQQLRALSQDKHALVVTATQSDAKSYNVRTVTRSNFSEDKRKLAHATGVVGLNQMPEEKDQRVMRLNWVVRRNAYANEYQCVYVAGCLDIANPAVCSTW